MYTRCPHCQTTFRLAATQLKTHAGQVRCGRCQEVFQGDQHLVERAAKKSTGTARKRGSRKSPAREQPAVAPVKPDTVTTTPETSWSAGAPILPSDIPPAPLEMAPRVRTGLLAWSVGSVVLSLGIITQGLVFYGQDLVRAEPSLSAIVATLCAPLPCRRLAHTDLRSLDLVETQVMPHPRYDKALRVRATLVNRASVPQPYPRLEVSLIDAHGQLLARRVYAPREYQARTTRPDEGLAPHVAVTAQLDITSPGTKASGFEILLLPPRE